jgi:DNA-binding beta-propeller fold protein YncE
MMSIGFLRRHLMVLLAFLRVVSASAQDAGLLHLEKEIPLPGVEGRVDHFSADDSGQRVFLAALGNSSVEVIDVRQGERIAEIKGLKEPQGVYYDAKTSRLYVATGGDGKLRIYDGKSLAPQTTLEFGDDADNVRFDRQASEIWVGYGSGGIGIIDSIAQKVGTVSLGSHPESFQFDQTTDRVYVNVPKELGVAVVDRKTRSVIAKWGLGASFANYPMALDDANKRLFVGCRLPARLVILDTSSGGVVATLPIVGDTDDVFYDARKHSIYVIGGAGAVDVLRQRDPNNYERVARIPTASGARTGFFAAASNRLYVAVPHRGSQAAKVLQYGIAN